MSYFEDLSLRGIWLASSGDDGKTWRYPSDVPNLPQTATPDGLGGRVSDSYLAVAYPYGMPVIRTPDNLTLVGIEHLNYIDWDPAANTTANFIKFWGGNPDSGARAALVVLNYNAAGTAEPDQGSVIFKRMKPNLI